MHNWKYVCTRGVVTPSYIDAYTCARDLVIGGLFTLLKNIITYGTCCCTIRHIVHIIYWRTIVVHSTWLTTVVVQSWNFDSWAMGNRSLNPLKHGHQGTHKTGRKHGEKKPQLFSHCGSFDQPGMQSLKEYKIVFFILRLESQMFWGMWYTVGKVLSRYITKPPKTWSVSW